MEATEPASSSSSSGSSTPTNTTLPTSVVGAPEHLRDAIQRAQNASAARRSRARRKNRPQGQSVADLEARIKQLEEELAAAGCAVPDDEEGTQESPASGTDEAKDAMTEAPHDAEKDSDENMPGNDENTLAGDPF